MSWYAALPRVEGFREVACDSDVHQKRRRSTHRPRIAPCGSAANLKRLPNAGIGLRGSVDLEPRAQPRLYQLRQLVDPVEVRAHHLAIGLEDQLGVGKEAPVTPRFSVAPPRFV